LPHLARWTACAAACLLAAATVALPGGRVEASAPRVGPPAAEGAQNDPAGLTGTAAPPAPPVQRIRPPRAAGVSYPADPEELERALQKLLDGVVRIPIPGRVRAMLVPHAALEVSGALAANAFAQLGAGYDRVFVISVNHDRSHFFRGAWIPDFDAYRTPLGDVPVDALAHRLRGSSPFRALGEVNDEYVIENPLPFLQRTLGTFSLVPIVLGEVSESALRSLAGDLAAVADERTLFVFSLDLSNAYGRQRARQVDEFTLRRLLSLDPRLKLGATEGNDVLKLAVYLCRQLGLRAGVLGYWNSADLGLPRRWAVGYASVVFYEEDARALELAPKEWETLVMRAARRFREEMRGRSDVAPGEAAEREESARLEAQSLDPASALRDWRGCALRLVAGDRVLGEEMELYPSASLLETVDDLALRLGRRCRTFGCLDGAAGSPGFRLSILQVPRPLSGARQTAPPGEPAAGLRPDWGPEHVGLLLIHGLRAATYLGGSETPEGALAQMCSALGLDSGCAAAPRARLYRFGVSWSAPQSLRTNS